MVVVVVVVAEVVGKNHEISKWREREDFAGGREREREKEKVDLLVLEREVVVVVGDRGGDCNGRGKQKGE